MHMDFAWQQLQSAILSTMYLLLHARQWMLGSVGSVYVLRNALLLRLGPTGTGCYTAVALKMQGGAVESICGRVMRVKVVPHLMEQIEYFGGQ